VDGSLHPQSFRNGEVHDWYRLVLGYSDHLVANLIEELDLGKKDCVLDPFCGAGTTLVECMKHGVRSFGIDANPSSCFASAVKTSWHLQPTKILQLADEATLWYYAQQSPARSLRMDPTYQYLSSAGMIERGWITDEALFQVIRVKRAVLMANGASAYKSFLLLALADELVRGSSNIRFGPEIYCGKAKESVDALAGFLERVHSMVEDLRLARAYPYAKAVARLGDARELHRYRQLQGANKPTAVITSPPYPTEHDYTRNSRLELAVLELVSDLPSLRLIKRRMLRSHTKNVYVDDSDARAVTRFKSVKQIAMRLERLSKDHDNGFARYYPVVVRSYFGGMKKHFDGLFGKLAVGGRAVYIVGDQASYHNVHIPTAEILGSLAEASGFRVNEIRHYRSRRASVTGRSIDENLLFLEKRRRR
jgi:hypothetical protein